MDVYIGGKRTTSIECSIFLTSVFLFPPRDVSWCLSRRWRLENFNFFLSVGGWKFSRIFWKNLFVSRNFCIKKGKNDNWKPTHKKLDEENSGNWSWLLKITIKKFSTYIYTLPRQTRKRQKRRLNRWICKRD